MVMLAVVREFVDGEVEAEAAKRKGLCFCHINLKFSSSATPSSWPFSKFS